MGITPRQLFSAAKSAYDYLSSGKSVSDMWSDAKAAIWSAAKQGGNKLIDRLNADGQKLYSDLSSAYNKFLDSPIGSSYQLGVGVGIGVGVGVGYQYPNPQMIPPNSYAYNQAIAAANAGGYAGANNSLGFFYNSYNSNYSDGVYTNSYVTAFSTTSAPGQLTNVGVPTSKAMASGSKPDGWSWSWSDSWSWPSGSGNSSAFGNNYQIR